MAHLSLNTAIFKLIRWPNLLIVGVVQVLVFFKILLPAFQQHGLSPKLDFLRFAIFIGVTLCISAAGYIVNDLIDAPIDRANKPGKEIIGRQISEQTAYWLYFCINLIGFTASLYLAFYVRQIALVAIYPFAGAGLFLYSLYFKRMPLSGNLLVAAYCAAVAGIVWFAEREAFQRLGELAPLQHDAMTTFLWQYMGLAFLATLFREIVKDMEDRDGDAAHGARTLAVLAGLRATKTIAFAAGVTLAAALAVMIVQLHDAFSNWGLIAFPIMVAAPLAVALFRLAGAQEKDDFRKLSALAKWIILAGLFAPLFVSFTTT
ncbi:MAG: geranylgeranylglycerol-phosphate geranylgeranyltransferase [Saprospiraceae bacterium]|nr:geranylgeranylglycerol-phosphate geranylgeranyltransferase [Saprospiraceae bacterium]